MKRDEIWLVDFEPRSGSEVGKVRPAVIVSNDHANEAARLRQRGVVTVVPITSNVTRIHDFQVLLPASVTGLDHDSKAVAEHIRALDVRKLVRKVGTLTPELRFELEEAIMLHLALN